MTGAAPEQRPGAVSGEVSGARSGVEPGGRHLDFVKMEGVGNDYILVDGFRGDFAEADGPELARRLSDRHFGVGADGLIAMVADERAPCRMLMWNADGSRGAMCGNGLRCLGLLAWDTGVVSSPEFEVATDAGMRRVRMVFAEEPARRVASVLAWMGEVEVADEPAMFRAAGRDWAFYRGWAGNPHAVVFVDEDPMSLPLADLGRAIQGDRRFPAGVNLELVQVRGDGVLFQRTFERGSGETQACGTGATVVAEVARRTGRVAGHSPVRVQLLGGELRISWDGTGLVMEGPARTVFRGRVPLDSSGLSN